jgi:hypothetical protein
MTEEEMNDVRHTSTYAKAEETIRKDERSRVLGSSPETARPETPSNERDMKIADVWYTYGFQAGMEAERKYGLAQSPREPVAWRWRVKGAVNWVYDPRDDWREFHKDDDELEFQPLFGCADSSTTRRGPCQCCGEVADLKCGPSRFGPETWACTVCWSPDTSPIRGDE